MGVFRDSDTIGCGSNKWARGGGSGFYNEDYIMLRSLGPPIYGRPQTLTVKRTMVISPCRSLLQSFGFTCKL